MWSAVCRWKELCKAKIKFSMMKIASDPSNRVSKRVEKQENIPFFGPTSCTYKRSPAVWHRKIPFQERGNKGWATLCFISCDCSNMGNYKRWLVVKGHNLVRINYNGFSP